MCFGVQQTFGEHLLHPPLSLGKIAEVLEETVVSLLPKGQVNMVCKGKLRN